MKEVIITADGSCLKNPGGAGGYGIILEFGEHCKELSGGDPSTTNNRMELMGVIVSLESLKEPCHVTLRVDSQYVMKGMTEWMPAWKKRNFTAVKNKDLWFRLLSAAEPHEINWQWVKGHAGDSRNERADEIAYAAAKTFERRNM